MGYKTIIRRTYVLGFILTLICIATYVLVNRNRPVLFANNYPDGKQQEVLIEKDHDSTTPDERAAFAREMCKRIDINHKHEFNNDTQQRVLIHRPMNISLCYVPKAGCTYWKRVFIALAGVNESGDKKLDTLELPPHTAAHGRYIPNLYGSMNTQDEMFHYVSHSRRFIFVRDPYARLFSAYVDKFHIYEMYWVGLMVMYGVTKYTDKCVRDLTFTDFLRLVVNGNIHWIERGQPWEHWVPITDLCRPCMIDYEFIGKVETFERDREYIMSKIGLDSIMNSQMSFEETARDTISHVRFYNPQVEGKCMTKTVYINRLYDMYKLQGYIAPDGIIHAHDGMTQEEFNAILVSQFEERNLTEAQWVKQRHETFVDAYKHVPIDVKLGIAEYFKLDFQIFGYDPKPREIFPV